MESAPPLDTTVSPWNRALWPNTALSPSTSPSTARTRREAIWSAALDVVSLHHFSTLLDEIADVENYEAYVGSTGNNPVKDAGAHIPDKETWLLPALVDFFKGACAYRLDSLGDKVEALLSLYPTYHQAENSPLVAHSKALAIRYLDCRLPRWNRQGSPSR